MDISIFMAGARPKWWPRLYESLKENRCKWELIIIGPNRPDFNLPENFRYEHCIYKPTQAYSAGAYLSKGKIIGYSADDAVYERNALDLIVDASNRLGKKTILTQVTVENGKDVTEEHHFFRHCPKTPVMAPMAFFNREWFWEIGGYDRNFVSGQSENDLVMRAYQDGGKVQLVPLSKVYLNHEEVHGGFINKIKYRLGKNSFRTGYFNDRRYLEECWVKEGYGTYNEKTLEHGTISPIRLLPHHPFDYKNILTVPQGPSGRWSKYER